jgi:hypothetical protein
MIAAAFSHATPALIAAITVGLHAKTLVPTVKTRLQ